jgi:hypothetical protein
VTAACIRAEIGVEEGAGFQISKSDHSMFIRRSTSGIVLLLLYVDDIAFSSNDLASINELKRRLRTQFDMKDLGDSKSLLEIKVMRSQRVLEPSASIHWIYCQKLVFLHANRNKI